MCNGKRTAHFIPTIFHLHYMSSQGLHFELLNCVQILLFSGHKSYKLKFLFKWALLCIMRLEIGDTGLSSIMYPDWLFHKLLPYFRTAQVLPFFIPRSINNSSANTTKDQIQDTIPFFSYSLTLLFSKSCEKTAK